MAKRNLMPGIERTNEVDAAGNAIYSDGTLALARITVEPNKDGSVIHVGQKFDRRSVTWKFTLFGKFRNRAIYRTMIIGGSTTNLKAEKAVTRDMVEAIVALHGLPSDTRMSELEGLIVPIQIDIQTRYSDGKMVNVVRRVLPASDALYARLAETVGPQFDECAMGPGAPLMPGWINRRDGEVAQRMMRIMASKAWKAKRQEEADRTALQMASKGRADLTPMEVALRRLKLSHDEFEAQVVEPVEAFGDAQGQQARTMVMTEEGLTQLLYVIGDRVERGKGRQALERAARRWHRFQRIIAELVAKQMERTEEKKAKPTASEKAAARKADWIAGNGQRIKANIEASPLFRDAPKVAPVPVAKPFVEDDATYRRRQRTIEELMAPDERRGWVSPQQLGEMRRAKERRALAEAARAASQRHLTAVQKEQAARANGETWMLPKDHPDYCPF